MPIPNIMFQGTASTVGKSIVAAAFCRIFKQDGYRVAPFKSQNMALNSYITLEGGEMGRAQVVQAEAAGIEPTVDMNPILLKPTSDYLAQVIVKGEVFQCMSALQYDEYKPLLMDLIMESYRRLALQSDIIVIEGAGSPAEVNLRDRDIVNMGLAEQIDTPVILIGDIDKGGVFASLFGTVMLLPEAERKRIKGFIINKFRGDSEILKPGLTMIEDLTGIPVLGVIPYFNIAIDDEDSVTERFQRCSAVDADRINIGIINYPYMSNFTDFAPLENQPGVQARYFNRYDPGYLPDLVILPGSKNTIADLRFIRESRLDIWLKKYYESGGLIMGICGGFQMLGVKITDPDGVESELSEMKGLGFLDIHTRFLKEKITARVSARVNDLFNTGLANLSGVPVAGYEIHMGVSTPGDAAKPFTRIESRLGVAIEEIDGYASVDGRVFGTYIHGIFDTPDFLGKLVNMLRGRKGFEEDSQRDFQKVIDYKQFKEAEYDKLADIVRNNVDVNRIYEIVLRRSSMEIK